MADLKVGIAIDAKDAIATIKNLTTGIVDLAAKASKLAQDRGALINMGVSAPQLERISNALGDTVDKITLAQKLKGAGFAGIRPAEMEGLAKTAAVLAKRLSASKEEMLAVVASGDLTDIQLRKIGLTSTELENKVARAARAFGDNITEAQRRAVAIRAVIESASKSTKGFRENTKQVTDAAAEAKAAFKNLKDDLLIGLGPTFNAIVKKARLLVRALRFFINRGGLKKARDQNPIALLQGSLTAATTTAKSLSDRFGEIALAIQRSRKETTDFTTKLQRSAKLSRAQAVAISKLIRKAKSVSFEFNFAVRQGQKVNAEATKARLLGLHKQIQALLGVKAISKEAATKEIERVKKVEAASKAAADARRSRNAALRKRNEEDFKARRNAARDLTRNFSAFGDIMFDAISNLGGPLAEVASGLRDTFERGGQFAARFGKTLEPLLKKSRQDLLAMLKAQKGINNEQTKRIRGALILKTFNEGSVIDIKEKLINERQILREQRAQLSSLSSQGAVVAAIRAEGEKRKEIDGAIASLTRQIEITAMGTTGAHKRQTARLIEVRAKYISIKAEAETLAAVNLKIAKLNREQEISTKEIERRKSLSGLGLQLLDIQQRTAALGGQRLTQIQQIEQASKRRVQALTFETDLIKVQARILNEQLRAKGAAGVVDPEGERKLDNLRAELALREKMKVAIDANTQAQIVALGITQQFMQRFEAQFTVTQGKIAGLLFSSFNAALAVTQDAITGVISALISGADISGGEIAAKFLGVLGDLAVQIGAFLTLAGAGFALIPGFQASAGAVVAGIALTALGLGLKGVAGAVGTGAPSPPSASKGGRGSSGGSFSGGGGIPGQQLPASATRETFFIIGSDPSDSRSQGQKHTDLVGFLNKGGRFTGRQVNIKKGG